MIKLTYDSSEYTFDNNLWLGEDGEVGSELSAKLSTIASESGASLVSSQTLSKTVDTQSKSSTKKKKIRIFEN